MPWTEFPNLYCRVVGRPLHLDPSYSLYSTDSEDQVLLSVLVKVVALQLPSLTSLHSLLHEMCRLGHNYKQRPGSMCGFTQWHASSWKVRYPVIATCVCCISLLYIFNMRIYVTYSTEPKMTSQTSKPSKKKTPLGKNEAERKRVGKKAGAALRINKRPGDVIV